MRPFSTIRGRDLFADHFQPALVLFAPLGLDGLAPTGLLIVQSALLAAVAPALYILARRLERRAVARPGGRGAVARVAADAVGQPLRLPPGVGGAAAPRRRRARARARTHRRVPRRRCSRRPASRRTSRSSSSAGARCSPCRDGAVSARAWSRRPSVAWFLARDAGCDSGARRELRGLLRPLRRRPRLVPRRGPRLLRPASARHAWAILVEPSNMKVLLALVLATGGLALLAPLRLLPAVSPRSRRTSSPPTRTSTSSASTTT